MRSPLHEIPGSWHRRLRGLRWLAVVLLAACGQVDLPFGDADGPEVEVVPADTDAPGDTDEAPDTDAPPSQTLEPEQAAAPSADAAPTPHAPPLPLLADLGHPDPWGDLPEEPEAAAGRLAQDRLPALQARAARAEARAGALTAWRVEGGALDAALPDLAGEGLHEPAVLEARLRMLDRAAERRHQEAAADLPVDLPASIRSEARQALAATHEAEARAAALERDALLQVRAWLRGRPWLQAAALEQVRAPWEATLAQARSIDEDDPSYDEVATAALAARQALGGLQTRLAVLRTHLRLPGAPPVDLAADVEALGSSATADAAALRLALTLPEAPVEVLATTPWSEARQALEASVAARVERLRAATLAVPTQPRGAVGEAQEALVAAEARRDALPPALRPAGDAAVALAEARLLHAESGVEVQPDANAAATRREAEEVRAVGDAAARLTATLIAARAPAEDRVAKVTADLEARRQALKDASEEAGRVLSDARAAQLALADPTAERSTLDADYRELRALLRSLREDALTLDAEVADLERGGHEAAARLAAERQRIASEEKVVDDLADPAVADERRAALTRWAAALDREASLREQRLRLVRDARDKLLVRLEDAAQVRAELAPAVGPATRAEDRASLFQELVQELWVVGPTYLATWRERLDTLRKDPWSWLTVAGDAAQASLWLLVAALLWWAARRYADRLVELAIVRFTAWRGLRRRDVEPVRGPLHRALVTTIDVLAAWLLLRLVPAGLPEATVLLRLVFEVQLVRLEVAVFELLVAKPPGLRPALLRLHPDAWRVGRRAVLALGTWLAVRRVLLAFAHDVLAGFATEQIVRIATGWALVVLIIVLLHMAAPHVRARVRRHPRDNAAIRLLENKPPTAVLNGVQAIGGLAFLGFVVARDLIFRVANQGAVAGWFAAVDRIRLGQRTIADEDIEREPLPDDVRETLLDEASRRAGQDRAPAREAFLRHLDAWRHEERQGLIALLGDTGDGRKVALQSWATTWEGQGLPTHSLTIDRRLSSESDALSWLASAVGLDGVPESIDAAVEALEDELPEGVYVVYGLHLAFLRAVGGFDALRTLLEVWHADGQRRCWVLAFYRPAWRYLEKLGTTMNVHLVRAVVDLPPLDAPALRVMTTKLAEDAGYELDFEALVSTGALAGDPEVERERAIEAFYRLLASASGGIPAVALRQWVACLSPGEEGVLHVDIDDAVRLVPVPDLSDDHLFVLAAVRTQGELHEHELVDVLNMGAPQVRALVRQMIGAGLLVRTGCGVHLDLDYLPRVTLTLRRRHFLHWS